MSMINYNDPNQSWLPNGYDPYKGMNEKQRMMAGCLQGAAFVLIIIFALAMCALLGSCTTTKYVLIPEYHTDTVRIVQHQRDSIYLSDSIYVNDFVRDDTVYKTVERWHTQYRDRWRTDTIYQSKRDSIPYPVEVTKEVPAELTWWQQTRLLLANIVLILLAVACVVWAVRLYIKNRLPH